MTNEKESSTRVEGWELPVPPPAALPTWHHAVPGNVNVYIWYLSLMPKRKIQEGPRTSLQYIVDWNQRVEPRETLPGTFQVPDF